MKRILLQILTLELKYIKYKGIMLMVSSYINGYIFLNYSNEDVWDL